jgi:hypothetical protein
MKKRSRTSTKPGVPSQQAVESPLEPAGEVVVTHFSIPPAGPPAKQIHPRRPLPLVPTAKPKDREERP